MSPSALLLPLLAALLPIPLVHSGAAPEGDPPDVITLATDPAARMTVPVRIGTAGPFRFLIDTGAQATVVSSDIATRLALPSDRAAVVLSVAGSLPVQTVLIDELGLGRRSYYSLVAPVLQRRDIGADGIVGIDGLQDQRVTIDFRKGLIAVSDAPRRGGDAGYEIVVTARSRLGQLIMTDALVDGVRTAVVIDTGAETTIGNQALLAAMGRRQSRLQQTALVSVTGQQVAATVAPAGELQIHGITLRNVAIAFTDAPPFASLKLDRKPALLLGMRELRAFPRLAIDFRRRQILFDLPDAGPGAGLETWGG